MTSRSRLVMDPHERLRGAEVTRVCIFSEELSEEHVEIERSEKNGV